MQVIRFSYEILLVSKKRGKLDFKIAKRGHLDHLITENPISFKDENTALNEIVKRGINRQVGDKAIKQHMVDLAQSKTLKGFLAKGVSIEKNQKTKPWAVRITHIEEV